MTRWKRNSERRIIACGVTSCRGCFIVGQSRRLLEYLHGGCGDGSHCSVADEGPGSEWSLGTVSNLTPRIPVKRSCGVVCFIPKILFLVSVVVPRRYAAHSDLPTGSCVSLTHGQDRSLVARLGASAKYELSDWDTFLRENEDRLQSVRVVGEIWPGQRG